LIPALSNENTQVLHYQNLQLYLDLGFKLKQVHRVLEFDQSAWLKQYIDSNTQTRTQAKNSFERDFFKLMNNSVFGKAMENILKRVDVRLVTDKNELSVGNDIETFLCIIKNLQRKSCGCTQDQRNTNPKQAHGRMWKCVFLIAARH